MASPTQPIEAAAPVAETKNQNAALLERMMEDQARAAARYKPVMSTEEASDRYKQLRWYIENVMEAGVDYGTVPGVEKPFLFKSGAQGLCTFFGYVPFYETLEEIEDWKGERFGETLFYYKYKCVLMRDEARIGEGIGSANSWEAKYRYRWIPEDQAKARPDFAQLPKRGGKKTMFEPTFALDKAETTGKYGKPAEYWERFRAAAQSGEAVAGSKVMGGKSYAGFYWTVDETQYRIANDGFPDVINTTQKQATKRAYIEATLSATGASRFFTQDEDAVTAMQEFTGPAPAKGETKAEGAPEQPAAATAPADNGKPAAATPPKHAPVKDAPGTAPSRPVPEELQVMFETIDRDPKHFTAACNLLQTELENRFGGRGVAAYNAECDRFERKFSKVRPGKQDLKDCLLNLWDEIGKLAPPVMPVKSEARATDEKEPAKGE